MKKIQEHWSKWLYLFTLAVAVIIVYKILDSFPDIMNWLKGFLRILGPFLLGTLIAYLLYIPSRKIENLYKKVKIKFIAKRARTFSVITVYLLLIILIIILINVILPVLTESIVELASNFQGYYENAINKYNELPEDSILKGEIVKDIVENVQTIDFKKYINLENITNYLKGAINIATSIFDVFVTFIVSVYVLLERTEILNFIKKIINAIFPKKAYQNIGKYFNRSNEIFFKYISSQFIDAIVVAILTTIAMSIMGVKYAVLLGVMIGIFNMIQYFGAIIAVIIAALITLITGGFAQAIWMLIVVIILQQIDANIINPKIVGDSLKISPLLVIFAVTLGGAYFGILGMFLAVPIITVCKIIIENYVDYKNSLKKENTIN